MTAGRVNRAYRGNGEWIDSVPLRLILFVPNLRFSQAALGDGEFD